MPKPYKLKVTIEGGPCTGKTNLAKLLVEALNKERVRSAVVTGEDCGTANQQAQFDRLLIKDEAFIDTEVEIVTRTVEEPRCD